MPVPKHINVKAVELAIDPNKDVDGFHPMTRFKPCTPLGIVNYLKACDYDFVGKDIAVIGRSDIVGKPMARMLTDLDATVTLCHSKTVGVPYIINESELAIVAIGKRAIDCEEIHTPIVDVGINFDENGKMCGDCYNTEGKEITPVPGGVGLLTRLAMLQNIIEAAEIF
jgi:methylenetetrahydrofolate dehydrogenase (NADP+)/methenyltetrahydrofolate cyclohydrolase